MQCPFPTVDLPKLNHSGDIFFHLSRCQVLIESISTSKLTTLVSHRDDPTSEPDAHGHLSSLHLSVDDVSLFCLVILLASRQGALVGLPEPLTADLHALFLHFLQKCDHLLPLATSLAGSDRQHVDHRVGLQSSLLHFHQQLQRSIPVVQSTRFKLLRNCRSHLTGLQGRAIKEGTHGDFTISAFHDAVEEIQRPSWIVGTERDLHQRLMSSLSGLDV
mmetsp:Transcript_19685/g.35101  ORF Transcript_19685/g.35101 Transcript_19685/m.35101 type:complete len:218 (+) Transcript_19685:911-1564(+)